ncbi:MAG: hypothetical protein CM15mP49_10790 [Actinomycetota bacterium]|nr:MAG: hypothetical protein CM15mP49_10790 [Actinomycetota bacterium]
MLSIASRYLEYMGDINAIFKSYDIRGLYPQEIDEEVCRNIGCVCKVSIEEDPQTTKIIVGVDMRLSSESLSDQFVKGILALGLDVIHLGLSSTDMLYYASGSLGDQGQFYCLS